MEVRYFIANVLTVERPVISLPRIKDTFSIKNTFVGPKCSLIDLQRGATFSGVGEGGGGGGEQCPPPPPPLTLGHVSKAHPYL